MFIGCSKIGHIGGLKKVGEKMRERKYKDGTYGSVSLPYENIPDNYNMESCLTNGYDLSYAGFMKTMVEKYRGQNIQFTL